MASGRLLKLALVSFNQVSIILSSLPCFLAEQDPPGSAGVFPCPRLESVVSTSIPDFFEWTMVFRYQGLSISKCSFLLGFPCSRILTGQKWDTHTHIHTNVDVNMCVYICVCVYVCRYKLYVLSHVSLSDSLQPYGL